MPRLLWSLGCVCLTLALIFAFEAVSPASDTPELSHKSSGRLVGGKVRLVFAPAKKPKKSNSKKAKAEMTAESDSADSDKAADAGNPTGGLKFSRDIAPILVSNCMGCHNEKAMTKNGKFDLSTFEKLVNQPAASGDPSVVPGKPEESHLYLRLTGEEKPRMPRGGNNRRLSENAIEKIGQWVKEGAKLDAGIDPKAQLASFAASPEQLRKDELSKMSGDQRDKIVETKGLERWKQANSKVTPEITPSKSFLLFGNLPKDRVTASLKTLETQWGQIKSLVPVDSVQKVGLYVFNDRTSFVEFARTVEKRDVESTDNITSNLSDSEPYIAVIDPAGGKEEPAAAAAPKKASRSRRSEGGGEVERSLAGVITEALANGAVKREGKAPVWLSSGIGAYFSAKVDPRSTFALKLRRTAFDVFDQGWVSKGSEILGGEGKVEDIRAVGYAMVETMATDPRSRPYVSRFVREMLAGGEKLDDCLQGTFEMSRDVYLAWTGEFVQEHFASRR